MSKTMKTSELKDSDMVALYLEDKQTVQDNQVVVTKKAGYVFMTWFLAKTVLLGNNRIDNRRAQLAGLVETKVNKREGGKTISETFKVVQLKDDILGDPEDLISDEDFDQRSAEAEAQLNTFRDSLETRAQDLLQRERELEEKERELKLNQQRLDQQEKDREAAVKVSSLKVNEDAQLDQFASLPNPDDTQIPAATAPGDAVVKAAGGKAGNGKPKGSPTE